MATVPPDKLARMPLGLPTCGLVLLILVQRGWERLGTPDLWGEDGQIFLGQALSQGVHSLLTPMAGSYFTIERLVMIGALRLVPLAWVPAVVCAACVVMFAAVASTITSRRYEWLIPSPAVRVLAACLLALLPGLHEMLGNLCNLNWILFCWLAFVGLKDPALPITKTEIAISLLVAVSIGTTILLLPLFGWRIVFLLQQGRPTRDWAPGVVHFVVLAAFGVGLLLVAAGPRPPASSVPSALQAVRVWYDHAARLAGFTPWIGDRLTYALWRWSPAGIYRAAKIALLASAAIWGWSGRREPRTQALLVFVVGVSLWTILAIATRPYAMEQLQGERGPELYAGRYSFITSFAGLIFWLAVVGPAAVARGRLQPIAVAFIALNLVLPLHRFAIGPYGVERRWLATVDRLERSIGTGCPRAVTVRQYPDPWQFTYQSPRPVEECR